jgi:hypothetical protein
MTSLAAPRAAGCRSSSGLSERWVWPLPRLDGTPPAILSVHEHAIHCDELLMVGYPGHARSHGFVPVFAAQDGIITHAARTPRGATLHMEHPGGWSTRYHGLAHLIALPIGTTARLRRVRIRAGEVLGHLRGALQVGFGLAHVSDRSLLAVELAQVMHAWPALPWFESSAQTGAAAAAGGS